MASTTTSDSRRPPEADPAHAWRGARVTAVWPQAPGHVLHSYFNGSPEHPAGDRLLVFASNADDAHRGDLVVVDRADPERRRTLVTGVAVEDAHRQANQRWVCGGDAVVFNQLCGGEWRLVRIAVAGGEPTELCRGRQLFWGASDHAVVPVFGPPHAPGAHRDLELVDVRSGHVSVALTRDRVVADHPALVRELFGAQPPDSIAYPILSPDGTRVMFKLSAVGDGRFRSPGGSHRRGLFVYHLGSRTPLVARPEWGHPAWLADGRHIRDRHQVIDTDASGAAAVVDGPDWYPRGINTHAAPSPDGTLVALDVARGPLAAADGLWTVVIGGETGEPVRLHHDVATGNGTSSWRPTHPHPVFSPDGRRCHFHARRGDRVVLYQAERGA